MKKVLFKLKIIFFYGYDKLRILSIGRVFLSILGGLWLLMEVYSFFFSNTKALEFLKKIGEENFLFLVATIILISIILAAPKTKIRRRLIGTDIDIIVEFCDIWQMKGAKIISGADTFDTDIHNGMVSPWTLHGQLIYEFYNGDVPKIDNEIDSYLEKKKIEPVEVDSSLPSKTRRYKIGTTVILKPKNQYIYFSALSRKISKGVIEIKPKYIDLFLNSIWSFIEKHGEEYKDEINIPVIATGKKKLPAVYTNQFLLFKIIESFVEKIKKQPFCRIFRICLHPKGFKEYDLNMIENYLDNYVNEFLLKK